MEQKAVNLVLLKLGKGCDALSLRRGEISALTRDFYGTEDPISDGKLDAERKQRFLKAHDSLVNNRQDQPNDAWKLLGQLQGEVDKMQEFYEKGRDSSEYYKDGTGLTRVRAIDKLIKVGHFQKYQ